jgi:hypothetical protein
MLCKSALAVALAAILGGLTACQSAFPPAPATSPPASATSSGQAGTLREVHDPGQVTGSLTGPCHARDGGQLPDPGCTPGAIDPAVTQQDIGKTICVSGYTRTVRPPESQTERAKFKVAYPAYGLADSTTSELDHLVPLELGGANDLSNLWPEAGSVPNAKDQVEFALHKAVCARQVDLAAARLAIATDWKTAEAQLGIG